MGLIVDLTLDTLKRHRAGKGMVSPAPAYSTKRGLLFSDDYRLLTFQFNPSEISISKNDLYEDRKRIGVPYSEPIWIYGDTREIAFQLYFDATAGSNYKGLGGLVNLDVGDSSQNIKQSQLSVDTLQNWQGTLPQVELLQSFQYPVKNDGSPYFVNGGAKVAVAQFVATPDLTFSFGNFYIKCKLKSLDVKHELFNKQLIPIRTSCQVRLVVIESIVIDTSLQQTKEIKNQNLTDSSNLV